MAGTSPGTWAREGQPTQASVHLGTCTTNGMSSNSTQLSSVTLTWITLKTSLNFDALSPKVLMRPSHLTDDEIWGGNRRASPETRQIVQKYLDINRSYNQPTSPQTAMSAAENYGNVSFQFFTSRQCPRDNINNHSVVTVMTYQGVKFLMPGDNESPSWKELLGRQDFVHAIQKYARYLLPLITGGSRDSTPRCLNELLPC